MGSCISNITSPRKPLVQAGDGGKDEFHLNYIEDRGIGEGEFGKVVLCLDQKTNEAYAVKKLKKGVQIKNNVVYSAISPDLLLRELNILRLLQGKHYTLKLIKVFETSDTILLVTEYCSGGDMMFWVANALPELETGTVSRIAYQLLDATKHCHKHNVIHRDIKPENIMFCTSHAESELRLIDFGGSLIQETVSGSEDELTGFMGSAFYMSPEMFQHKYTAKTDVWSIGVTLYVLVAGFPTEHLQATFDMLQSSKEGRIQKLTDIPNDLPDSFFSLMEDLLCYQFKNRKSVKEVMHSPFVQFHKSCKDEIALEDVLKTANESQNVNENVTLKGSVRKHSMYLDYRKFERGITTVIVTMLQKDDLNELLNILNEQYADSTQTGNLNSEDDKNIKLKVVKVKDLIDVLKDMNQIDIVNIIQEYPRATFFFSFSYEIRLLVQFVEAKDVAKQNLNFGDSKSSKVNTSVHGSDVWKKSLKKKHDRSKNFSTKMKKEYNSCH